MFILVGRVLFQYCSGNHIPQISKIRRFKAREDTVEARVFIASHASYITSQKGTTFAYRYHLLAKLLSGLDTKLPANER